MKKGLPKDAIIKELSELPTEELKSDKTNIYYCNLAIALKEELLREKNLVPTDKILTALKNTGKKLMLRINIQLLRISDLILSLGKLKNGRQTSKKDILPGFY
jgi:hypothetical protein